ALRHNDLDKAEKEYTVALRAAERLEDQVPGGNCASRLGQVAFRREQWKQALVWFDFAMKHYAESKSGVVARRSAVSGLAMTLCKLKNYDQAEFCAKQLIEDSRWIRTKDGSEMREGLIELADIYRQSGQLEKATAPMEEIYASCRQYHPITWPETTLNMCYLSTHYWSLNKKEQCRKTVNEYLAEALKSKPENLQLPARLLDDYAEALIKAKEFDKAAIYLPSALKMLDRAPDAQKEKERCRQLMDKTRA
ncbi:MAG TPA: hypothetical protein V6D22_10780, partial [Candidatus Obscuribacterales bacterium]